mgnify:CR=1 FL=1
MKKSGREIKVSSANHLGIAFLLLVASSMTHYPAESLSVWTDLKINWMAHTCFLGALVFAFAGFCRWKHNYRCNKK